MQKGQDIRTVFEGLTIIHHNCPGMERRSITFKEHLLFIPLHGEITIELPTSSFCLGAGRMLYLPAKSLHSFASSVHQGERLIVLIEAPLWKSKTEKDWGPTVLPLSHIVKEILFYLLVTPKTKHPKSLTSVLIETLSEHLELTDTPTSLQHIESKVNDARVVAALKFMRTHLDKEISMDLVAKKSGLSLRSLNRLVFEQTGLSPRHALIRYRVAKAQEHFLTGKNNVTEIAQMVGYNSLSQFIAAFRSVTGQLPSEFSRMASFQKA